MEPKVVPVHHARYWLGLCIERGRRDARKRGPALRAGAVLPLIAVDRKGDHASRGPMIWPRSEYSCLRQLCRKFGVLTAGIISLDRVQRAVIVIKKIELAGAVFAKGHDPHGWSRDLRHLGVVVTVEARGPQSTRLPVAKNVGAAELGELAAA